MDTLKDVLVLSARAYKFTDKETGEVRQGVTVYYINNLTPVVGEDGTRGCPPIKCNFNSSVLGKFSTVPGIYDLKFTLVPGSMGRTNVHYEDAAFKKAAV